MHFPADSPPRLHPDVLLLQYFERPERGTRIARNKERGVFDEMDVAQLAFERDKLRPVAEIYNEFNAMIRESNNRAF